MASFQGLGAIDAFNPSHTDNLFHSGDPLKTASTGDIQKASHTNIYMGYAAAIYITDVQCHPIHITLQDLEVSHIIPKRKTRVDLDVACLQITREPCYKVPRTMHATEGVLLRPTLYTEEKRRGLGHSKHLYVPRPLQLYLLQWQKLELIIG